MGIRRARMVVGTLLVAMTLLGTALAPAGASGRWWRLPPGAPGVGDDYFPLYGNGYDVKHYLLKVSYDPATDRLRWAPSRPARQEPVQLQPPTSSA